ncbi:MAG: hypothetical protein QF467_06760 [SAR202 cluster bacterium]|jgi:hypothetical protein|nr:hypothetical protein [SAR202 cluster bacterium]
MRFLIVRLTSINRLSKNSHQALKTMTRHLLTGGIVIIVPWSTKETFKEKIMVDAVKHPHVKIARMENVKLKTPNVVVVMFHHLIGRDGQVTYHTQTMEVGLFSQEAYISAFQKAGLELVEVYEGVAIKMGAFIGRLPRH